MSYETARHRRFPWTHFRATKAAVKMHTLLDFRYVLDRGYVDFARLHALDRAGAFFVTRAVGSLAPGSGGCATLSPGFFQPFKEFCTRFVPQCQAQNAAKALNVRNVCCKPLLCTLHCANRSGLGAPPIPPKLVK